MYMRMCAYSSVQMYFFVLLRANILHDVSACVHMVLYPYTCGYVGTVIERVCWRVHLDLCLCLLNDGQVRVEEKD